MRGRSKKKLGKRQNPHRVYGDPKRYEKPMIVMFADWSMPPDMYEDFCKRLNFGKHPVMLVSPHGINQRIYDKPTQFVKKDAENVIKLLLSEYGIPEYGLPKNSAKHKKDLIFVSDGAGVNTALKTARMIVEQMESTFNVIGIYTMSPEAPDPISSMHKPKSMMRKFAYWISRGIRKRLQKRVSRDKKVGVLDRLLTKISIRMLRIINNENKHKWDKKERREMRKYWHTLSSQKTNSLATQLMGYISNEEDIRKDIVILNESAERTRMPMISGLYFKADYFPGGGIPFLKKKGLKYHLLKGDSGETNGSHVAYRYKISVVEWHLKPIIKEWSSEKDKIRLREKFKIKIN